MNMQYHKKRKKNKKIYILYIGIGPYIILINFYIQAYRYSIYIFGSKKNLIPDYIIILNAYR